MTARPISPISQISFGIVCEFILRWRGVPAFVQANVPLIREAAAMAGLGRGVMWNGAAIPIYGKA